MFFFHGIYAFEFMPEPLGHQFRNFSSFQKCYEEQTNSQQQIGTISSLRSTILLRKPHRAFNLRNEHST